MNWKWKEYALVLFEKKMGLMSSCWTFRDFRRPVHTAPKNAHFPGIWQNFLLFLMYFFIHKSKFPGNDISKFPIFFKPSLCILFLNICYNRNL